MVAWLTKHPPRMFILSEQSESKDLSSFPIWESVLRSIATKDLSSHATQHASLCDAARGFARVGRVLPSLFRAPGISKARLYPCAIIALAASPSAEKATQE